MVLACTVLGACVTASAPKPSAVEVAPPIPPDGGAFSVAENMLDTWNTVGKVLVAMDDVHYEGRAQMLGLYSLRFRGEQFLIRTQAIVLHDASEGAHTRVDALDAEGKPTTSPAAIEMLQRLAVQVPMEVAKYRQPIELPKPKPVPKKKKSR